MRVLAVIVIVMIAGAQVVACPYCYGDSESSNSTGMTMAIVGLLVVTGGVFVAFGSFFFYLRNRAMKVQRLFLNRLN